MVAHQATAAWRGTGGFQADAQVVRVTRPDELPAALAQRTKQVVIENDRLERIFSTFLYWSTVWLFGGFLAWLIAFGIEHGYKIETSLIYDWKIQRIDGKITLTPRSR